MNGWAKHAITAIISGLTVLFLYSQATQGRLKQYVPRTEYEQSCKRLDRIEAKLDRVLEKL